jgi:adenosylmethionine-8-amino-7-oxononanoate aminotransferase
MKNHPTAQLDLDHVWHPFTQMRDWRRREPRVIVAGRRSHLEDQHGRRYLDANASIWTNLHGHNHPRLNAALRRQLRKVAHVSALGLANEPAAQLAARLVAAANTPTLPSRRKSPPADLPICGPRLTKVFFSDDGSTALEVALKLAYEYSRRTSLAPRPRFLALQGAYHGDTIGAVSLGHIDLFHRAYSGLLFHSDSAMAPYCYRCPFNRAQPERADARTWRHCRWECVDQVRRKFDSAARRRRPYTAFVFEPLIQGAAGMIPQPEGWLQSVTSIAREHGALLVADEVLTGFGRTGIANTSTPAAASSAAPNSPSLFACHRERVQPDFLCLAKGLTGGYLPMAATLTSAPVFNAFLGRYDEFKTFFHGHSFTANPLAAATSLASLDLLQEPASIRTRARLESALQAALDSLWAIPSVGDIRRVGLIAGIELVRNWRTREPFELREQAGIRVCEAMAQRGVLTRPIGNVVVLMPPYSTTTAEVRHMVETLALAIRKTLGNR